MGNGKWWGACQLHALSHRRVHLFDTITRLRQGHAATNVSQTRTAQSTGMLFTNNNRPGFIQVWVDNLPVKYAIHIKSNQPPIANAGIYYTFESNWRTTISCTRSVSRHWTEKSSIRQGPWKSWSAKKWRLIWINFESMNFLCYKV